MIHPGLVSITFRKLKPAEIVSLVRRAGLRGIEWGGDVHVPPGDIPLAREVAHMTAGAGLQVAAYGSYYHVAKTDQVDFAAVVDTASTLGAPTIRVWAGERGSADADDAYRAQVVAESRRIAELAAAAGMTISFEFHGHTLTDTNDSALALLRAVDHPAAKTYWQPPVAVTPEYHLEGLASLVPWLTHVHVYHWLTFTERYPLAEGEDVWRRYLDVIAAAPGDRYAMIEFVKDDAPANFLADAVTLVRWLS